MLNIVSLALVLGLAALGGILARLLRQPLLLGYIAAGVVIAALGWLTGQQSAWEWMGQLGVTLLLFLVGLELPIAQLKAMGRVALLGGLGQVLFTTLLGYPLLLALGFSPLASWYLSLALSFSSTAITLHILTEKKDLQSLYGKITIGILLIQDFVAIGLLMILSGSTSTTLMPWLLVVILIKGGVLTTLAIWLSGRVLPKLLAQLGASGEILLIVALTWCLGIAAVVASPLIGFSVQIGGFLAGLALSGAAEHLQIGARIRPLRDFFLTLFFVYLGTSIHWGDIGGLWGRVLVLAVFVLVAKPLITWLMLLVLGFRHRPAFLVSVSSAQISEFSLILVAAVAQAGWVGNTELAVMAMVGAITMIGSNYLVLSAARIFARLRPYLTHGPPKSLPELTDRILTRHLILVGCNRTGRTIYPVLQRLGGEVIVVDFNPQTVQELNRNGRQAVYGDVADYDLYEQLNMQQAQLVVSTVTDLNDNLQFLNYLRSKSVRPLTIVTAADATDAKLLYQAKADYVVVPAEVGGELIAHLLTKLGLSRQKFKDLRPRLGR